MARHQCGMTSEELFKVSRRDEGSIKGLAGVDDPMRLAGILADKLSFNDDITCDCRGGYYLTNAFPTSLNRRGSPPPYFCWDRGRHTAESSRNCLTSDYTVLSAIPAMYRS